MLKSKWPFSFVAILTISLSLTAFVGEYKNEKELIKASDKYFDTGEYDQCLDLYSQLVSTHPKNPNYNFKYGVCLLYSTEDKVQSLRYLSFSVKNENIVNPKAFYFYGQALQQNYDFDRAIKNYKKYQSLVKGKESQALNTPSLIKQCKLAKKMIFEFQKMDVVSKKSVGKKEFFRSYRLGSMKRSIIITPEEFQVSQDKKSKDYSLIVHNHMVETVYFSSYNKDGSIGGKDIFKVRKMPDGTFSKPINLGPLVNTPMDEDYPYLHPNGRLLYFASKGRNGIGGFDIFKSELDTNNNLWGEAVNVGFSVNSPADDILYVSDMDENIAYFASNRTNKNGEITVYKILPNKKNEPVIAVRGQVEIEGIRNQTAKVTVYNEEGEELNIFTSQKLSGTFNMILDEDQTYIIGVAAPGKGESKSKLVVPKKAEIGMISKKFIVKRDGSVILEDNQELLASAEETSKMLRESANLDVNQNNDIDFNTKVNRPTEKLITTIPTSTEKNPEETEIIAFDAGKSETTQEEDIISGAESELNEIIASKQKVKKQIDATYYIANKKKNKTDLLKDDIEMISEELSLIVDPNEKKKLHEQLDQKTTELKANAASATTALQFAKSKEREFAVKEKQEKLAQTYVEAVKLASTSNNSPKSIADLERARVELDEIQEEIKAVQEKDGADEAFAKTDAAKKRVTALKLENNTAQQDVADIINEQKMLADQAKATKNKGFKEELNLQIDELKDELAESKVAASISKAKLDQAKSEYKVLSSTQNVFDEVYNEADDESVVAISDEQKKIIQNNVITQKENLQEVLEKTAVIPIVKIIEPVEIEIIPKEEASYEIAIKEELTPSVESIQEEYAKLDENAKVTPEIQYVDEIGKAKLEKKSLKSFRDERELLEMALANVENKQQRKELESKIAELDYNEAESLDKLKIYIARAQKQEKDLSETVVSTNKVESDILADLSTEVVVIEKEIEETKILKAETKAQITERPSEEVALIDNTSKVDASQKNTIETNDAKVSIDTVTDKKPETQVQIEPGYEIVPEKEEIVLEVETTKLLFFDLETATDNEVNVLLESSLGVRNIDFEFEVDNNEAEILKQKIQYLKTDAIKALIAANKAQIEFENSGEVGTSPKSEKQKQKALKSQFEIAKVEGELNIQDYTVTKDKIDKEMFSVSGMATDEIRENSKAINEKWVSASVVREQANLAKEEKEKIRLINEAASLEYEALVLQEDLKLKIKQQKEIALAKNSTIEIENNITFKTPVVNEIESVELPTEPTIGKEEYVEIAVNSEINIENEFTNKLEVQNSEIKNERNNSEIINDSETAIIEGDKGQDAAINNVNYSTNPTNLTESNNKKNPVEVSLNNFNKKFPSVATVEYGNEVGYGIKRDAEIVYSKSAEVSSALFEAKENENEALDYFYQAKNKKQLAEKNPKDAKKYNKEADKLLIKGNKAQVKANESFRKVNEKELAFNNEEIKFAFEYDEIIKKDSAEILVKQADELFEMAAALRKEASKEKDLDESFELINEAYAMEIEAIKKQDYIITGELDGETSDISEEITVVTPVKIESKYTKKAAALRAKADLERDPEKKKLLFEEAINHELAGNSNRTKRLLSALNTDKITYENNEGIVETLRKQSHNNNRSNKAWEFEKDANALFTQADSIKKIADQTNNEVERLVLITASNEMMHNAKEKQASAIKKYQESKAEPDEPNFIAEFRKEFSIEGELTESKPSEILDEEKEAEEELISEIPETSINQIEEQLGTEVDVTNEVAFENETPINETKIEDIASVVKKPVVEETKIVVPGIEDEIAVAVEAQNVELEIKDETTVVEKTQFVEPEKEDKIAIVKEIQVIELEVKDEITIIQTPEITEEKIVQVQPEVQEVKSIPSESSNYDSPQATYKQLIIAANEIEAQEVRRVEDIMYLKNQAGINRKKSEEILAQVDGLVNEEEILTKLAEANKYRLQSEQQEIEAENQEIILKNNVLESRAQREEAKMILAVIAEEDQAIVIAEVESNNEDLKKVREFLRDAPVEVVAVNKTTKPVEDIIISKPQEITEVEPINNPEPQSETIKQSPIVRTPTPSISAYNSNGDDIDMYNIKLLDEGSTESSIVEDEFTMGSAKIYKSAADIPVDPKMPNGIIYQVQVGAFRNEIDPSIFNGLTPLVGERTSSGIIRYKVGYFRGFKSANMAKGRIREIGYQDAFVVVFYDGQRITLDKAEEVIEAAEESEKFIYDNLVQDEVQQLRAIGIKEEEAFEDPTDVSESLVIVNKQTTNKVKNTVSNRGNGLSNDLLSINGLFYTVQVGVFTAPRISSDLKGVTPLYTEKTSNGYLRYTTGVYRDYSSADTRKDAVRVQGIKDAYVIAYNENKKITATKAREVEGGSANNNSNQNGQAGNLTTNKKVIFKVQVGAYKTPIVAENTAVFKDLTNYEISNIKTESGLLIYMIGNYATKEAADKLRQEVIAVGASDCFVVALVDGKRIPMTEALQLVKQ